MMLLQLTLVLALARLGSAVTAKFFYNHPDVDLTWCNTIEGAQLCCEGTRQTPIDIVTSEVTESCELAGNPIRFSLGYFSKITGKWFSTGTTAEFKVEETACPLTISGGPYGNDEFVLEQFHFHWGPKKKGSEHYLDGKQQMAEIHFVHYNSKYESVSDAAAFRDGLAVLGVFFKHSGGATNAFMEKLNGYTGDLVNGVESTIEITLSDLFGSVEQFCNYVNYRGSLTTPTCNEVVNWVVFTDPIKVDSDLAFSNFRDLTNDNFGSLNDNYRPILPTNGRPIFSTFAPTVV